MKNVFLASAAFLAVTILFVSGCSKISTTTEDNSIYSEMLCYATHYADVVNNQIPFIKTKANEDSFYGDKNFAPNLSCIDEKFLEYIELYSLPENVYEWDEQAVLELVDNDNRFSTEEKTIFVKSIAAAYFLKNEFSNRIASTKGDPSDCEEQFKEDMRRATRNAAIAFIAALLEPSLVGEAAALVYYYCEIDDAEEDYNDCMEQQQ